MPTGIKVVLERMSQVSKEMEDTSYKLLTDPATVHTLERAAKYVAESKLTSEDKEDCLNDIEQFKKLIDKYLNLAQEQRKQCEALHGILTKPLTEI